MNVEGAGRLMNIEGAGGLISTKGVGILVSIECAGVCMHASIQPSNSSPTRYHIGIALIVIDGFLGLHQSPFNSGGPMFFSCSQLQPAIGASKVLTTSPYVSSRSYLYNYSLKPGRGGGNPAFFSLPSRYGLFSLGESASHHQRRISVVASLKPPSGKGFGKKNIAVEKTKMPDEPSEATGSRQSLSQGDTRGRLESRSVEDDDDDDDEVPEVVTNRMLKRIALTVGVPLALGLLLFPFFFYLKVVNKMDVPEWLPVVVSMFTFGTAGFGITYGIVSSSWDPAREGSLLGWKEAQVNWPLIWEKTQSDKGKK